MSEPKRLYRSTTNRVIAGVCGGLGDYFAVDPTLIRVAFIILLFGGGAGVLAYIVLWIIIPERGQENLPIEEKAQAAAQEMKKSADTVVSDMRAGNGTSARNIFGIILIAIGIMALGKSIFPSHWIRWDMLWAVAIIAIGAAILFRKK